MIDLETVGIVVIGRNEGQRLRDSLSALCGLGFRDRTIYVDSGSTDDSVDFAHSINIEVLRLDMSVPFTAARARNEGFERLMKTCPETQYVQFVDGDCVIDSGWLDIASSFLQEHDNAAVVCGILIERNRYSTVYNRLCHLEWQKSPGEIRAAGGIFMVRAKTFAEFGGFDPAVIAAEDDELCLRLRRSGHKIFFLNDDMATHDAAMTRFSQWWKRAERAGYAYANGAYLHGRTDGHFKREVRSIIAWGLFLPIVSTSLAWHTRGWSLCLLVGYAALIIRVYRFGRGRGWDAADSRIYALFTVLAKFPHMIGLFRFHWRQLTKTQQTIIEYKIPTN